MRAKWCVLAIGISLAVVTVASAEEVIYFSNGTYMKIYSHEVQGDMIKVRLDGTASMAFPIRMVDKIENASGIVYGGPTNPVYPNQIVPQQPRADTPYPVSSAAVVGVRSNEAREADPDTAARRAAASRMQAGGPLSGQAFDNQYPDGIASTIGPGPSGTMRLGNHYVVGTNFNSVSGRPAPFKPARLGIKPGVSQDPGPGGAPPEERPPQDSADSSGDAPPNQ